MVFFATNRATKHMGGLNGSPLVTIDMWQPQASPRLHSIWEKSTSTFTVGIVVRFGQKLEKNDFLNKFWNTYFFCQL
jgi:hypothetical protein